MVEKLYRATQFYGDEYIAARDAAARTALTAAAFVRECIRLGLPLALKKYATHNAKEVGGRNDRETS